MHECIAKTDVGEQRDYNEDSVLAVAPSDDTALLAVADGMGGHKAGDVASQLAIDTLRKAFGPEGAFPTHSNREQRLNEAIAEANESIYTHEENDGGQFGMGTTVVAALIDNGQAIIGNVGDSRAYTIDDSKIKQETVDQSLVQELVEQDQITEEEATAHPQRNVLSQSLGTDETVDPDFYEVAVEDALLLCSDGLTEEVSDDKIQEIVIRAETLDNAGQALIDQAKKNGGSDNVSAILYKPAG